MKSLFDMVYNRNMDISDYSTRLQTARKDFREQTGKLRNAQKRQLDNLEKVNKTKLDKRKRAYLKSVDNIAQMSEENANRYKLKTKEAVAGKKKFFLDKLKTQGIKQRKELGYYKEKFQRNLNDIRNKYFDSVEIKEDTHRRDKERLRNSSNKRFDIKTQELEKDIENLNESSRNKLIHVNKDSLADRREIIDKNSIDLAHLEKQNKLERARDRDKSFADLEKLQSGYKNSLEKMDELREDFKDNVFEQRKESERKRIDEIKRFSTRVLDKNVQDKERRWLANKRMNMKNEKRIRDIEDQSKRRNIDPYRYKSDFYDQYRMDLVKERSEKRVQRLMNTLLDNDLEHNFKRDELLNEFKKNRAERNAEYSKKIDEVKKEGFEGNLKAMLNNNDGNDRAVKVYRDQLYNDRAKNENDLKLARTMSLKKIKQARREGLDQLNHFVEKSSNTFEKIKKENEIEKNKLLEDASRELYLSKMDIKHDFSEYLGKKEASYEDKLQDSQNKYKKLQDYYERKLDVLASKFSRELNYKQKIFEVQREDQNRAYKIALANQEEKGIRRFVELKSTFEDRLAKIRHENDSSLNDVMHKYEEKMHEIRTDSLIKKRRAHKFLNDTVDVLKKSRDKTTKNQRLTYETRLKEIKMTDVKAKAELIKELSRLHDAREG